MTTALSVLEQIQNGKNLGYKSGDRRILHGCIDCGKLRWVRVRALEDGKCFKCRSCANKKSQPKGENSPNWKGGFVKHTKGYTYVYLYSDDPYYPMSSKLGISGYVLEHRLVMAQYLERCLTKDELVHHLNGIKNDNSIENLQLVTKNTHTMAYKDAYNKGLADGSRLRDKTLEQQVRLLQWQIKELTKLIQLKLEVLP